MITAGIDVGSKTVKVVILQDGKVLARSLVLTGFEQGKAAEEAFALALKQAGLSAKDIQKVVATGAGRTSVSFATESVSDVAADARGAVFINPNAKTVIDVGAEEGRGISTDTRGKVLDFAVNERCAAGAGTFTEAMARAIEVKLEDMGELSLKSTQEIPLNAQCAVFAESEVVSLVHAKTSKEDIARAIHDGISNRIAAMARRVGVQNDIVLIGGVAKNKGFVASLKRQLEADIKIPDEPEYVGALGAALIAAS
ncbi:MAG: acyl-CoA dehydratase activase [Dehalococcoidia bacterium]|nr:acyl-CoA dehydratase activase [Dehalococcoidia bacterium]